MPDDVVSCAKAESYDDLAAPLSSAVPTAIPAESLAAKPFGTSTNRSAGVDNGEPERTTHSSPAGHRRIFPPCRLGADPRMVSRSHPPRPAPLPASGGPAPLGSVPRGRLAPPPAALAPAGDTGNTAAGGTPARSESYANPGWPANAANDRQPPDTPDCNTAPGHTAAQRTLRSLSAGNVAAAAPDKSLALKKIVDHYEVDPRERQLPNGQVPGRTSIPLRDALNP